MGEIQIVALSQKHIQQISRIHLSELEVGVLSLFGLHFLEKMYRALLERNWGFVAVNNDEAVGFIFAIQTDISLLRCLSIRSIILFFFNSITNPRKFLSFVSAFRKMYLTDQFQDAMPGDLAIELSQFAVKDHWKGQGIGRKLIEALEDKGRACGARYVFTRTHNPALARFYTEKKNGKVLKRISLSMYDALLIRWSIAESEGNEAHSGSAV